MFVGSAWGITTTDYISKASSWISGYDNGSVKLTSTTTQTDANGNWGTMSTGVLWFKDDSSNGWSICCEETLQFGAYGAPILKILDTPDGEKTWLGSTCVYNHVMVSPYITESHSSLPMVFWAGVSGQTNNEALSAMASSATPDTATVDGTSAYSIDMSLNLAALNSRTGDPNLQYDTTNDTFRVIRYINALTGAPIKIESTSYDYSSGKTFYAKKVINSITDNPTIPSGTFDLGSDTPSMSLEDAVVDWLEAHGA
jgi:hypothetical protein